jgi:hypothetical protein
VVVVETCSLPGSTESFLHQCRIMLESRVTALSRRLLGHKIEGEVAEGAAKEQIVETSDQFGADLIVIGAHGESGLKRRRIGNVVAAVLNNANCCVEVVKPRRTAPKKQTAKSKQAQKPQKKAAVRA